MKRFKFYNNLTGWGIFIIAAIVYLLTIESTASFWDCGEFIAASYKMQIGHPPGAPLFLMVGKMFSLLAGRNKELVPVMINSLSALASAFTILFLFWTITHLARRIVGYKDNYTVAELIIILGSAAVGSLSYTFSDTFWFSAVEGEVYASSSLFTALVFWAILKWENVADEKNANRWLILIAYLMGLSIGVHLLNLLAIPAIVLIFYFRKYKATPRGVISAVILSVLILAGIMYVLVPGIIEVAALFDRLFVNGFNMPLWSGVFFYLILLVAGLSIGIYITHKKGKYILNTILLVIAVICIGYSSFAAIVIRSNAAPPMNQNNPDNMYNLLYYLNREQYGERPLLYGQYFNAPASYSDKKKPVYEPVNGRYKIVNYNHDIDYDPKFETLFPRMWSNSENHISAYIKWAGLNERQLFYPRVDKNGKTIVDRNNQIVYDHSRPKRKPSFMDNIRFMLRYQMSHMYFRYFMWNFSGRQNDIQAQFKDEINKGNWMTGIKALDGFRLGPQDNLPRKMAENKARNRYFAIPLILGLIGLLYHYKKDQKGFWVVMALFIFTGLAIVIYLNQNPMQPRERDYAYAGSFYAFSVWIGLALLSLFEKFKEKPKKPDKKFLYRAAIALAVVFGLDMVINHGLYFSPVAAYIIIAILVLFALMKILAGIIKSEVVVATVILLLGLSSPALLGARNWDDHDRSGRHFVRDIAANYLNSCEKDAILFTNGDNDTFPLWYAQDVEGIRTDVRVVNLSYLGAGWYIDQMKKKAYQSDPLPISLSSDKYQQGKREIIYLVPRVNYPISLHDAIDFVSRDDASYKTIPGVSRQLDYIPQKSFVLKADSSLVFSNGTIKPNEADKYLPEIEFAINRNFITKNQLMVLDLLATNNWERPIYYAITVSSDNYLGLSDYFEMAGLTYRIVPAKMKDNIFYYGGVNPELMYDRLMNKFRYSNLGDPKLYYDENMLGMLQNLRNNFNVAAKALLLENKADSAIKILHRGEGLITDTILPYGVVAVSMAKSYVQAGDTTDARRVINRVYDNNSIDLKYYQELSGRFKHGLNYEKRLAMYILDELARINYDIGDWKTGVKYSNELQAISSTLSIKQ